MTRTVRLCAALVAAISLGATAACSVSKTDGEAASTTTTAKAGSGSESAGPVRGVTDDSVKIGLAVIDVNAVKSKFGVDLGNIPDGSVDALVKDLNSKGGINGLKVEVVQRPFMPIGTEDSEAACRELIEDHQVYAVAGMFLGDGGLCVTETYSTPYLSGWGLSEERQARSKAPFLTVEGSSEEVLQSSVEQFLDDGVLDKAKVAVYHEGAESPELIQSSVVEPLKKAKVDVVSVAQLPSSGDAVKAAADIDRIFQKFQSDGADTLLSASGAAVLLPALERTTWTPQLLFTNGQFTGGDSLDGYGLTDPSEMKGSLASTLSVPSEDLVDDKQMKACLDTINKGIGTDYTTDDIFPKETKPGSREVGQLVTVCQLWEFVTQVIDSAGEDLSPKGLLAGLDTMKDFSLAGRPDLSLSSTKWGADSAVRLWKWDDKGEKFVPTNS